MQTERACSYPDLNGSCVNLRPAVTDQEKSEAFRLRWRCYQKAGLLHPGQSENMEFQDWLDTKDNAITWLLHQPDQLKVASIRTSHSINSAKELLAHTVFGDALSEAFAPEEVIVEANRFVSEIGDNPLASLGLTAIFRAKVAHCLIVGATGFVAAVRVEHERFYKRLFDMKRLSDARRYPGLLAEMVLIGAPFQVGYARVLDLRPDLGMNLNDAVQLIGTNALRHSTRPQIVI